MSGLVASLMFMPNPLMPEVRVDKNGVAVTRHVKQSPATTRKPLPVPALTASQAAPDPERAAHMESIMEYTSKWMKRFGIGNELSDEGIQERLDSYSDDSIRLIRERLGDRDDKVNPSELEGLLNHNYSETSVREYMVYSTDLIDCEDLDETSRYISGLRQYPRLKDISDVTLADKDTKNSCRALLRIAFHLHCMMDDEHPAAVYEKKDGIRMPVIKSPSLVKLVLDNPDRASDIAEYIEEHGFSKTKTLAGMVADTHHATRDGYL